jgi:hypothetical protein
MSPMTDLAPRTSVTGCSCSGGMEWHTQDCAIWSMPPAQALAAVEDARQRVRDHTAELNRRLAAQLRSTKEA